MGFYVFPHPAQGARRESAVCLRGSRGKLQQGINRLQAWARVQRDVRRVARACRGVIGWSDKRRATLIAPGEHQSGKDVGAVLAPKEIEVPFKDRPQADTSPQPPIVEQE